jgi:hypothetical protein
MNKRAVTKAQMRRAVDELEARGKTIAGIRLNPDGSADVLLTGAANAPQPSDPLDAELAEWAQRHGYG